MSEVRVVERDSEFFRIEKGNMAVIGNKYEEGWWDVDWIPDVSRELEEDLICWFPQVQDADDAFESAKQRLAEVVE